MTSTKTKEDDTYYFSETNGQQIIEGVVQTTANSSDVMSLTKETNEVIVNRQINNTNYRHHPYIIEEYRTEFTSCDKNIDTDDEDDDKYKPKSSIRRITHFPSHQIETNGQLSKAKQLQDHLNGRKPLPVALTQCERKARRKKKSIQERLLLKSEKQTRRELSGNIPEGYEEYFT